MLSRLNKLISPTPLKRIPSKATQRKFPAAEIKKLGEELERTSYSHMFNVLVDEPDLPQDPVKRLYLAIEYGDLDAVKDCIENAKTPIDAVRFSPFSKCVETPLMVAIYCGNQKIIRYLIENHADVNFRSTAKKITDKGIPSKICITKHGMTPLNLLILNRYDDQDSRKLFEHAVAYHNGNLEVG